MKLRFVTLLALFVLSMVLGACSTAIPKDPTRPNTAVLKAEVTDYITNTEERNNNTYYVWVRTDTTSAYCTFDETLYQKARALRERVVPVTIDYAEINRNDPEYNAQGTKVGLEGCSDYSRVGRYSDVVVYRLINIHEAGNGEPLGETNE